MILELNIDDLTYYGKKILQGLTAKCNREYFLSPGTGTAKLMLDESSWLFFNSCTVSVATAIITRNRYCNLAANAKL